MSSMWSLFYVLLGELQLTRQKVEQSEKRKEEAMVAYSQAKKRCKDTVEEIERVLSLYFPDKVWLVNNFSLLFHVPQT